MVYQTFLKTVKSQVQEKLGDQFQVKLHRVLKNNGVILDGLSILSPDRPCAPTIYLNSYYEECESGIPLSVVTEQIVLLCREQAAFPSGMEQLLCHFDKISGCIVYKLVNASENNALLSQIPHYLYLDLAVVFYLIIAETPEGQVTTLIHNEHLSLWNVTREHIFDLAAENTPRLFPAVITPIESALRDILRTDISTLSEDLPALPSPAPLYVLTNQSGINGAACLLYNEVLKNFAAQIGDDLIILPSSIHEVLLAPAEQAFSYEELNEMIVSINCSEVPAEDQLSDHLYRYLLQQDCVINPFSASGSDGTVNLQ